MKLKKSLGRSLALAGLATVGLGPLMSPAYAASTAYVGSGVVHTSTGGGTTVGNVGNGGVNLQSGNTVAGNQYVNNITSNAFGDPGTIRTVGANLLASYNFVNGGQVGAVYNASPIVLVFSVEGTTSGPGATLFNVTSGRLGLFSIAGDLVNNGFNKFDPTTWGATNAAGTALLTPVAVWDFKPAEPVVDNPAVGGPGLFNLVPSQVNQQSINATVGTSNQGFYLLRESTTFGGATLSGNDFFNLLTNPIPGGTPIADEGIVGRVDESVIVGTAGNTSAVSGGLGTAGFDALNTIACALAGLSDIDAGLAGCQGFANGFGGLGIVAGDSRGFNPSSGNPLPNTNDLLFTFGTSFSPIAQPVPEPATILLFLSGGFAALGLRVLQHRRAKNEKVS